MSAAKTYYQFSVDLSDYKDQEVYIAFRNINSAGDFYLDDVTGPLVEVPACQKPQLTIADITAKDAKLTWTGSEDADGYKVYYKLSTETAYQSVEVSDAELVFSDEDVELKPASMYNVYVEYTCPDDDETMTSAVYTFMTACFALTEEDLPKKWDFESGNTAGTSSYPLPACWARVSGNYPYVYEDYYGYATSGDYCLYSGYPYSSAIVALTPVDVDYIEMNKLQLSFNAKSDYDSGTLEVGVMTDPTDASTFTKVSEITFSDYNVNAYDISFASYTGEGAYPAFRFAMYTEIYIDDVVLDKIPDCEKIAEAEVTPATDGAVVKIDGNEDNTYNV